MYKKLLGIAIVISTLTYIFPTKAETSGDFIINIDPTTHHISIITNT